MRCLISLALLAVAPVAMALDEGFLVQAAARARENFLFLDMDAEIANHSQYGDAVMLSVHPLGATADIPVRFRSELRLQVLMHSVCTKLGCKVDSAKFTQEGRQLDPMSTANAFGLVNGSVVQLSTPGLLEEIAQAKRVAAMEERRHELEQQWKEDLLQREAWRDEKRRKVAKKVAARAAEEFRVHRLHLKDEILLKFTSPTGGEDVSLGVKRTNWLEPSLELVAKRMGLDRSKAVFLFRDDEGALSAIERHDSVQTLGLEDGETIAVKVPHTH